MTTLLETAFQKASHLPAGEQNIVARMLMEEIESEQKWDELFANSEQELADLAEEALHEYGHNTTLPIEASSL